VQEVGRWLKFDSGVGIGPGQMHTEARYLGRRKILLYIISGLVLGLRCLLENGNFKKFSQYFLSKLSFDKLSWVFAFFLREFLEFCENGFFKLKCGLSWNKKPIFHLVQVSRESRILGLKNENPCFENFSGVLGSWFRLGGGEESQGFLEVKKSKAENGFLTMSSLDHNLSRTIFSFAIG
jgi:hypothetical protein